MKQNNLLENAKLVYHGYLGPNDNPNFMPDMTYMLLIL